MAVTAAQQRALAVGLCAASALLLAVFGLRYPGAVYDVDAATTFATTSPSACDFLTCEASGCDKEMNPHYCVDNGGCSPTPWRPEDCAEYCSLADCAARDPDGADSCAGVDCPNARCEAALGLCGDDAPFQCLEGSARFGCSGDAYGWASVADTLCSSCCDARTCAPPRPHVVGGDRDGHGCIASAGYSWCKPLDKCVRSWKTPCPDA